MKLTFAGCARNCAHAVESNILSLLAIGDMPWCNNLRIFVVENGSQDATRDIIIRLANDDPRLVPVFLDDLDKSIPVREARMAFCRDRVLDEIRKTEVEGLYIPVDLDSEIAVSLNLNDFFEACRLVTSGKCTGVFPSSFPYYYDIHALREASWCSRSFWLEIQNSKDRGDLWNLLIYIRYISARQKPHCRLQLRGLISVDSAFGGVGIYSLRKVIDSCARYSAPNHEKEDLKLCEHVVFNSFLDHLYIYPQWVIKAPLEHIEFIQLSKRQKGLRIIGAGIGDLRRLCVGVVRRFQRRIQSNSGNSRS